MALLVPQVPTTAGLTPVYSAANSTETINPDVNLWLHVKTAGTGTTVTITDPGRTAGGSAATNPTVTLGATAERLIYIDADFVNPSTGTIGIAYSSTATVTAGLFRI